MATSSAKTSKSLSTLGTAISFLGGCFCLKVYLAPSSVEPATPPFQEPGRKGPIPLGGAVLTNAGRLPYKAIIHVAGINMLWRSSETSIRDCVKSALTLAKERGFKSIAFPFIGAGTGGGGEERVSAIMRSELESSDFDGEVKLVRFRPMVDTGRRCSIDAWR